MTQADPRDAQITEFKAQLAERDALLASPIKRLETALKRIAEL